MSKTLTAAETAAVGRDSQRVVHAIKIDLTTDLLYCTGVNSVTLDSTTYTPRGLSISAINITDPRSSRATVTIDDLDGVVAAAWYTNRFSGVTVTITEAVLSDGAWVVTRAIPWICETASRSGDGMITLSLSGAGGLKQRAGLELGSRANWHLAPEPGTQIQISDMAATVR
jgi:hypothetical protein